MQAATQIQAKDSRGAVSRVLCVMIPLFVGAPADSGTWSDQRSRTGRDQPEPTKAKQASWYLVGVAAVAPHGTLTLSTAESWSHGRFGKTAFYVKTLSEPTAPDTAHGTARGARRLRSVRFMCRTNMHI